MRKVLMIIGGIVVGFIVSFVAIFIITSATSKKLVCESDEGKLIIMYNDKTITGYTSNGVTYDLEGQKAYAEQIGVEAYIEEFSKLFSSKSTGNCKVE